MHERERRLRVDVDGPGEPGLPPDERVLGIRRAARFDRRLPCVAPALAADLYVTERRVLFVGRQRVEVQLEEIRDAAVIDDLLLLALDGGRAITIGVSDAPALRAEIARARAGRHAGRDPGTTPGARVHLPVAREPRE